ncbi:hypothetical protein MBLNU230_g7850t1 [Neophaeotheca triangularis]
MTTVAAASYQRRKKTPTYGKTKRSSVFSSPQFDTFFDEPTPSSDAPVTGNATEQAPPKARLTKRVKAVDSKPIADTFDIPSSEDEAQRMTLQRPPSPPKLRARNNLVEDRVARRDLLASWEHEPPGDRAGRRGDGEKSRQNARCESQDIEQPDTNADVGPTTSHPGAFAAQLAPRATTAAARLAARKRANGSVESETSAESRAVSDRGPDRTKTTTLLTSSRKRRRQDYDSSVTSSNVPSDTPLALAKIPTNYSGATTHQSRQQSVENEQHAEETPSKSQGGGRAPSRKGNRAVVPTPRGGIKTGKSAPARLTDMIDDGGLDKRLSHSPEWEQSRNEADSFAHENVRSSRNITPKKMPQSPETPGRAGSLTPKQLQLWDQLLPSDPISSPGGLPIQKLDLASRSAKGQNPIPAVQNSKPEIGRRTRLVDRLKASAASSEIEDSSSEDDNDSPMISTAGNEEKPVSQLTEKSVTWQMQEAPPEPREAQSQPTQGASQSGPKITYARTRSYLQEDNFEDNVLGSMVGNTPQQPKFARRQLGQRAPATQTSAFDMEESDDETPHGRLRTIHELRAAGRSKRFAQGAQALLEDIADHSVTARSRRRGALLDLTSQLLDQSFAQQCVEQGFEQQLFVELKHENDKIASFILAAATALILTVGPPEHAILTLQSTGGFVQLASLLTESTAVTKLAKDRSSNMSRASQVALSEFVTKLQGQTLIWGEKCPVAISPRLVGLKAVDLLLGRLKNASNMPVTLPEDLLLSILSERSQSDDHEQQLSVSLLEALSASSPYLLWPAELLSRIAAMLGNLNAKDSTSRHTLFLAFRLCLNLTNNNERNSAILGTPAVVDRLLKAASDGFTRLHAPSDDEQRALNTDLLVLSIGTMINLAEHTAAARIAAIAPETSPTMSALIDTFVDGQKAMSESESLEQSTGNVAFGYLAIMLANLCQSRESRDFVAAQMPGRGLELLVTAVEEFVLYHEKVDTMVFEGDEGAGAWGAFTEKLRIVLEKVKAVGRE